MDNFNDSKALAIEIAKILDKKKAQDVRVLKVESLTVLTDYFVIASGTSTTQVASLADEVEYELSITLLNMEKGYGLLLSVTTTVSFLSIGEIPTGVFSW